MYGGWEVQIYDTDVDKIEISEELKNPEVKEIQQGETSTLEKKK